MLLYFLATCLFYMMLCNKTGYTFDHSATGVYYQNKTTIGRDKKSAQPDNSKAEQSVEVQKHRSLLENFSSIKRRFEKEKSVSIKRFPHTERIQTFDIGENRRVRRSRNSVSPNSLDNEEKFQNNTSDSFSNNTFTAESDISDFDDVYELSDWATFNIELTFEDVEKLLIEEETERFLDTFTDEMQRRMVKNHLYFCPYTPLCNFSFGLFVSYNFRSPCDSCSCDRDCEVTDKCCPDIIDFTNLGSKSETSKQPECIDLSLKKNGSDQGSFLAITQCPKMNETESSSHQLCIQHAENMVFEDIVPVTDSASNITYKNKHCASCNGATKESLVSWQPELTCALTKENAHTYNSESELIQFVLESETCNLVYLLPLGMTGAETCIRTVASCNQTRRWSSFDSFLFSACLMYENMYIISSDPIGVPGAEVRRYRNIFCALCNGESPESVLLYDVSDDIGMTEAETYAFSGLLKFDVGTDKTTGTADSRCEEGYIYDLNKESCLELSCSNLRTLKNDSCDPLYSQVRNVVYILTAELNQVGGEEELDDLFTAYSDVKNEVDDKVQHLLSELYLVPGIPDYGMFPFNYPSGGCFMAMYHSSDGSCSGLSSFSKYFDHYKVEFKFQILKWHGLVDIMSNLAEIENINLNISVLKKNYSLKLQARDFGEYDYLLSQSLIGPNECHINAEPVYLSKQKSCPLVSFSLKDSDCFEHKAGISCPTINVALNTSDYYFDSNFSQILICSDVYLATFAKHSQEKRRASSHESVILSLACTIISLVCLALSFITFCLFPRLRTLPGKNNMALILSLILAQSMFLISSFGRLKRVSVECKVVGVLTHFSWLLAIFWMNICTFHVFRVFTGIEKLSVQNEVTTFYTYFAYSVTSSSLLIITNIIISLFSSEMNEFGYGKMSCYISSEKMVAFTFGIPVGFVIITNLVMFVFFAIKIKTAPAIKKDVKNERNDIIIFTKLSTLTGFTWIFGFVYSWTDIEVFSYLFILLNASQGIFLFLSFVCNKRVLDMFRKRSFGVTSTSEAYRTRLTDSKQSTIKKL